MISSGNRAGTRHLLPEVVQCTIRSPLGNRQSWWRWGKTPFRAPHPVLLANTVFGVRVTAVIQHKIRLRAISEARGAAEALAGARGATAKPAQVEWRRHSQNIAVFEVGTKQTVLTGLKKKLRPLALGCFVPTFLYPDLCVFDELRSIRPTPDKKNV